MQEKSKKLKTFQIQYPAPYSHSWTEEKVKALSHTRKKSHDTGQIQYPAPYSHSWTEEKVKALSHTRKKSHDTGHVEKIPPVVRSHPSPKEKMNKREKNNRCPAPIGVTQITYPIPFTKSPASNNERRIFRVRKNATASRRPSQKVNRAIDPYSSWPPSVTRPDPTAAHLKYGVFQPPKNKTALPTKAPTQHLMPHRVHRTISIERSNKKNPKISKGTAGDQGDTSPNVVPTRRQLTISPPTHLDIKPKEGWRK